jgi:hypothetical protein
VCVGGRLLVDLTPRAPSGRPPRQAVPALAYDTAETNHRPKKPTPVDACAASSRRSTRGQQRRAERTRRYAGPRVRTPSPAAGIERRAGQIADYMKEPERPASHHKTLKLYGADPFPRAGPPGLETDHRSHDNTNGRFGRMNGVRISRRSRRAHRRLTVRAIAVARPPIGCHALFTGQRDPSRAFRSSSQDSPLR